MKLQPWISAICACKNRTKNLSVAIGSWLKHAEIDEIIIVDWDSDESLDSVGKRDPRIKIISVKDEPHWELTRAYNLAARFVSKSKILKLDCDYILWDNFFEHHPLEDNTIFYAWDRQKARDANEAHIAWLLYLHTENFWAIRWYNEIMKGWWYDDDDIYMRLCVSWLTRRHICNDDIYHIRHNWIKNQLQGFLRVLSNQKNIFISETYDWTKRWTLSEYTVCKDDTWGHLSLYFPKYGKKCLKKIRNKISQKFFIQLWEGNFWKKMLTTKNKMQKIKKIISWAIDA
jgi:hypothetical protein